MNDSVEHFCETYGKGCHAETIRFDPHPLGCGDRQQRKSPTLSEVGFEYLDESTRLPPTPRPTLTVSRLLN
jgi:hypothetical protein